MRPIELNQRRAAPAGPAAGQAFYTPADPRAALERSPAMELTERARLAQGGTGSLMGPVLQRYQAEQAAAATAYDGAEKPGSGAGTIPSTRPAKFSRSFRTPPSLSRIPTMPTGASSFCWSRSLPASMQASSYRSIIMYRLLIMYPFPRETGSRC